MQLPNLNGQNQEEQYSNLTFLDKGGMGQVYKAYDSVNKIEVAIKLIPIRSEEEEELLSREIKVSKEISSGNLVKTYYTDKITINDTEYFYIVQHFYPNGNLRKKIHKDIPFEVCLNMFLNLLNGLKELHTKIIHRDLKPENILIDNDNNLVITDFGLAKFIGEITKTRSFKGAGTIPYMAPECWLMEENKIQMDIYSLGIIFYELLTGEFPFNGNTEKEWQDSHIFEPFPNIDMKRKGIPTKIKQVILKMTNKRANERYSNVEEIISSIQESIEQDKEINIELEKLASISHKKTEEIRAEQLKLKQEEQKKQEYKKFIDYHILELKNKVQSVVELFNSRIEENKIGFSNNNTNGFSISLNRITGTFDFFDIRIMNMYEKNREETFKQNEIRRYGGILSSLGDSFFKKKNIIYIGRVQTNYQSPDLNERFGFNLLLVKSEKDIYGKWYIASFSDNGISQRNRKDFGLDLDSFFTEFEKCFSMHVLTVSFRELEDKDIYRVIEEIVSV
ncbi:MAG: serine/threonine protein kinase [Arcobacteraceae bacterium]|jgi:serine/threonine protein kinase